MTNKELITLYLQCNLHIIKYPLLVVRLTLKLQHYLRPLYKRFKQVIVSGWVGVRKYVGTKWLWGPERWDKNKMRAMDNDCYQFSVVNSLLHSFSSCRHATLLPSAAWQHKERLWNRLRWKRFSAFPTRKFFSKAEHSEMQLWDVDSFSLTMKQCAIFATEVLVISLVFVPNAGKTF